MEVASEAQPAAHFDLWWHEKAKVRATHGTGENEFYAPARYIQLAREVLGEIELDPAPIGASNARFIDKWLQTEGTSWPSSALPAVQDHSKAIILRKCAAHARRAVRRRCFFRRGGRARRMARAVGTSGTRAPG